MEIRGGFSTYNLSTAEKEVFAEYLQHSMNNPALEFIKYLLGDDYIKFIDVMSGTILKIPSAKSLEHDLELIRVFLYARKNGFSEISIKEASKMFNKTVLTIRRYVLKVSKVLGIEDTLIDGDELNNYIKYIKSVEQLDSYYVTKLEAKQDEIMRKKRESSKSEIITESTIQDTEESKDLDKLTPKNCESLEEFYIENQNNKYLNIIKSIKESYPELHILLRIRNSGNYIRIFDHSCSSKRVADCSLNRSGWKLVLYYPSMKFRDSVYNSVKGFYRVNSYGQIELSVSGIKTLQDFTRFIDITLESYKQLN